MKLNEKLHAAAIDGKHDFSELVNTLKKIRDTLTIVHGPDYGQKVSHHLALAVINFFKKDTISRNLFTKAFVAGKPHSFAAEIYGGGLANIWEWDVGTIDQFIFQLRRARVLPQQPYDPSKGAIYEKKKVKIKDIFGKEVEVEKLVKRKPDSSWFEGSLRRDAGAQTKHKLWEIANTLLPIFLAWLLWKYISQALKEAEGKKE